MTSKLIGPVSVASAPCAFLAVLIALTAACGIRSTLESDAQVIDAGRSHSAEQQLPGAGRESISATDGAKTQTVAGAATGTPIGPKPIDIFAFVPESRMSPAGQCLGCIKDNCGVSINACLNDRQCIEGLTCAIDQCSAGISQNLSGQQISSTPTAFMCLVTCFGGDIKGAIQVMSATICLTQTCSTLCAAPVPAVADGIGGLLGGQAGTSATGLIPPLSGLAGIDNRALGSLLNGLLFGVGGAVSADQNGARGMPAQATAGTGGQSLDGQFAGVSPGGHPQSTGFVDPQALSAAGIGNSTPRGLSGRIGMGSAGAAHRSSRGTRGQTQSFAAAAGKQWQ